MKIKNNFYIITGGPRVGKTTLINELKTKGYGCIHEAARHIIKDQITNNGDALPWLNTQKYSNMMFSHSLQDFIKHSDTTEPLFFDRGIPDTYGYELLMDFTISSELKEAVNTYRYNPTVFILPPWDDIYSASSKYELSSNEALRAHNVIKRAYKKIGYNLIEVPKGSPAERADFVVQNIQRKI